MIMGTIFISIMWIGMILWGVLLLHVLYPLVPKDLKLLFPFRLPAKFCTWLFTTVAVKSIKWSVVSWWLIKTCYRNFNLPKLVYDAEYDMWFEKTEKYKHGITSAAMKTEKYKHGITSAAMKKKNTYGYKDIYVPCDNRGIPKIDIVFEPSHKDAFIPNSACKMCGFPLSRDKSNFKVCLYCEYDGLDVVKASPEEIAEKHNQKAFEKAKPIPPPDRIIEEGKQPLRLDPDVLPFDPEDNLRDAYESCEPEPPPRPVKRPSKLNYE